MTILLTDTFVRANTTANTAIATGWGAASDGSTWSSAGGTPNWSILSNQGQVTNTAVDTFALLSSNSYADAEVLVRLSTSVSSTANFQGVFARYTTNNAYFAYVRGTQFTIGRKLAGTDSILVSAAFTQSANTKYWIRFRVKGTTLQAKVWADGSGEPSTWTLTVTDTNLTTGQVGIFVSPNVVGTTAVYDTLSVDDTTLGTVTLAGVGSLTATTSLATALSVNEVGTGTLSGTLTLPPVALTSTLVGVGTLTATFSLSSALASTFSGAGTLSATAQLSTSVSATIGGTGTLTAGSLISIFYVSPTGSDSNSGTSLASAWLTLAHAGASIAGGNMVLVADGTYTMNSGTDQLWIAVNGTDDTHRTIFQSINKWGAKIVNNITPNNTSANDAAIFVNANFVDVIGFEVTGSTASYGIAAYGKPGVASGSPAGSHIRIMQCYVHDLGLSGTVVTNSWNVFGIDASPQYTALGYKALYNEVSRCVVNNIGYAHAVGSHGIYMPTGYGTCANNIVSNCPGFGINFYHFPHHMTVVNNLVFKCGDSSVGQGGGIYFSSAAAGTADEVCDFCVVNNNIIRDCSGYAGIYEYNSPVGSVANNTFSNNSYFGNAGTTLGDFKSDVSSPNTNAIFTDPLFINYLASGLGDYHLTTNSPCVNAGTSVSAPTIDLDGTARPQGASYDIGPYEYLAPVFVVTFSGVGQLTGILSGPLILYGSNVAASLSTAGKAGTTTGGAEVAAVTTAPASGSGYVECFALGGTSTVNASLPAPSGKGWLLDLPLLEGMRLVAGPWAGSVAVSDANGGGPVVSYTIRFWQRSSGGTYAIIGSLVLSASQVISTLRAVKTFLAAAMPQTDFAVGDKLYIDFFINANGWASDVLSVYVSNSGTAGVAGDLEVDTAGYIPSGTAGVVTSYIPRALSALLVVTSTALFDTLSGTGQLSGAISTLSTALSSTFSGGGVLSGQVTANLALPTTTLAGVSSLSALPSLATSLATSQFTGSSTLAASILARTVLTGQFAGSSTLASTFQLATSLTGTPAGTGQFVGSLTANLTLTGIVLPAVGAFSGTVGLTTALGTTMAGGGQLAGTMALTSNLSTTLSGVGQLSALLTASLALPGVTLAGGGALAGVLSTAIPVALSTTIAGGGALNGIPKLATSLAGTPAGVGTFSSTMTASLTLASMTLPGSGALIGAAVRGTALSTSMVGAGTLGGVPSAALTLSGTSWAGVGALSGTLTGAGGLVGTVSGGSTLAGSLSAALTLIGTSFAGIDILSATVQASTILGTTLSGGSTLSGMPSARTALGATLVGVSTLAGTTALATALTVAFPAVGTLAGVAGRSTALGVALPGNGQLAAAGSAQTTLTSSFAGVSAAAFTLFLRTSLSVTLSGAGNVTSASLSYRAALVLSLAGVASLSGSLTVPVLAYLTATWKTRDGQVVWVTRDEQEATWKTRDGQVTWKIRS